MRVYQVKDGQYINSSKGDRVYQEVVICEYCHSWKWKHSEESAIAKSIEFIRNLSAGMDEAYGCSHHSKEEIKLDSLYPIREPYEYDSDQIRYLHGILQLVAFLGPTDIDMKAVLTAHRKVFFFGDHICFGHNHDDGDLPEGYFEPEFPCNLDLTCLLLSSLDLSEIQNRKITKELIEHFKRAWEEQAEIQDGGDNKQVAESFGID